MKNLRVGFIGVEMLENERRDVDFLVEFDLDARKSLFDMVRISDELTVMAGRRADVNTLMDLSRYFREEVTQEAEPVNVAP